jgi:ABC-2 type transport system ATP-binding protein
MIDVSRLSFDYPGVRALDDLGFHVGAGSITALVGPNGAGKTTLMRCLCGLEQPLTGSVVIDGIDVVDEPRRSHERLGYLSDFFGLYDDLSVARCLRYAAAANGIRADLDARVRDTAARLGLAERLDERAGALSRGLRQRVAIAQAIIHAPRVLVLDEPAAGLDPAARHELAALFRALQADGMTLLVSSHILSELEQYATHMLVLDGGRLLEHRALSGAARGDHALTLEFVGERAPLEALLAAHQGVSAAAWHERRVDFAFTGDARAQAALLRELVSAGIEVVSLGAARSDLQERYLASVGQRNHAP